MVVYIPDTVSGDASNLMRSVGALGQLLGVSSGDGRAEGMGLANRSWGDLAVPPAHTCLSSPLELFSKEASFSSSSKSTNGIKYTVELKN